MKKLLTVVALFCFTTLTNAQEVIDLVKPMKCSDAQVVMNHFATEYGEKPIWVGKSENGTYITLLMNKEKKTWTMLEYDSKFACVLGAGKGGSDPSAI